MSRRPWSAAGRLDVRPVRTGDAAACASLLNRIIAHGAYTVMTQPLNVAEQARYIDTFDPRGVFLVAVQADCQTLLGLQSVEPLAPATPALGGCTA